MKMYLKEQEAEAEAYIAAQESYVEALEARADALDFPLLLSGRINIDDALPSCSDPPPSFECAILPSFLADVDAYRSKLNDLAVANFID